LRDVGRFSKEEEEMQNVEKQKVKKPRKCQFHLKPPDNPLRG
jgi:hypothetical protein